MVVSFGVLIFKTIPIIAPFHYSIVPACRVRCAHHYCPISVSYCDHHILVKTYEH